MLGRYLAQARPSRLRVVAVNRTLYQWSTPPPRFSGVPGLWGKPEKYGPLYDPYEAEPVEPKAR